MKKTTKRAALCCAAIFAITAFSGCSSSDTSSVTSVGGEDNSSVTESVTPSDDIGTATKGVIKIGSEIGYPPFEYYDADGTTAIGVDVELGKALAKELGYEVELVDTAWDGIFSGLQKGDYDCIISAVTITPDRLAEFDFSEPYIKNYQCIVSLKDSDFKPTSPAEAVGKRIGYQEETTSDIYLTDYAKKNDVSYETFEYAKVMDVFTDLEKGRLDCLICDSTVADSYMGADSKFEITWLQDASEGVEEFAVCINKGNTKLVDAINGAMNKIKESGELDEILGRYFTDISKVK